MQTAQIRDDSVDADGNVNTEIQQLKSLAGSAERAEKGERPSRELAAAL